MDEVSSNTPEQPVGPTPAPVRRSKTPLIALVIVLIAVVAVGVFYLTRGRGGLDPAVYMPKDVAIALTVDMSKSSDRSAALSYMEGVLKDAGMKDPEKDLFTWLKDGLEIDFQKEVLPHLSGQAGFALGTEMSGTVPKMVLVLGTKGESDSKSLVDLVTAKLKKEGVNSSKSTYKDLTYQRIEVPMVSVCVGAVGNALVCSASESGFKAAVDNAKGKDNLTRNEYFAKYRQRDDSNIMTVFYSGPGIYKLAGPFLRMAAMQSGPDAGDQMQRSLESATAVAVNVSAATDGFTVRMRALTKDTAPTLQKTGVDEMMSRMPEDAVFAGAVPGLSQYWPAFEKQMKSNPATGAQLEAMLAELKDQIGVDLFKEVLPNLTSLDVYFVSEPAKKGEDMGGHLAFRVGFKQKARTEQMVKKIEAAIAKSAGIKPKQVDIAGNKTNIFSDGADTNVSESIVGKELLLVVTGKEIKTETKAAMDMMAEKGPALTSSNAYQTVAGRLPKEALAAFFVNLQPLAKNIPDKDMDAKERKQFAAVVKKIGIAGGTLDSSGQESDYQMVVPFKK